MNQINWNLKDSNLPEIQKTGKFNYDTNLQYRVYGLQQADRPAILLEYNTDAIEPKKLQLLTKFFNFNGISAKCGKAGAKKEKHQVYIGVREDFRQSKSCISAINTAIHFLDGKLKLKANQKVNVGAKFD